MAAIVNKYHNLSLGTVLIFVDILIIGSSFPVFGEKYGYEMGLRIMVTGLCAMMIENFVLDYVMNARRESVQFLIFSRKYDEIAYAIGTKLDHGVTILDRIKVKVTDKHTEDLQRHLKMQEKLEAYRAKMESQKKEEAKSES